MPKAANVTTGKPRVAGAIFRAPKGTTLPTDAKSELDPAFLDMGYIGDDGVTNSNTRTSEDVKAWGGLVVMTSQTEYKDTFKFKFLETLNKNVLGTVYKESNVSGTDLDEGIKVRVNSQELDEYAWVIDMILRDNVLNRIVIPAAKISELGDVSYKDNEVTAFDVTLTAFPDEDGDTHKEYKQK